MASTAVYQLAMIWLDAGKSWHTWWNNAHYNHVYTFNVSPIASGPAGTVIQAEVTRVWRTHTQMPSSSEAEVHVEVKNVSSAGSGYCFVFMSSVGP